MAKILIVDDDADLVAAARMCLEGAGHEVREAANRTEGKAALDQETPDLLILDVMMDEPDEGIAMAQELKRDGFAKPILMLSSIGKITGMDYGKDDEINPVDDFVEKPVKPAVLLEKVNALLNK